MLRSGRKVYFCVLFFKFKLVLPLRFRAIPCHWFVLQFSKLINKVFTYVDCIKMFQNFSPIYVPQFSGCASWRDSFSSSWELFSTFLWGGAIERFWSIFPRDIIKPVPPLGVLFLIRQSSNSHLHPHPSHT